MIYRPLRDRVFVKPLAPPSVSKGGLVIPETAWRPSFVGRVDAIGPDVTLLREGDLVSFGLNNGQEHVLNGEPYLVMRESDVLFVIERSCAR